MTPTPDKLAEVMRAFRRRHGLTTAEAGAYFGLSARTIEGIEQGRGHSAGRLLELALTTKPNKQRV